MKHCDLCHLLSAPIQHCAFGELGVTLFLHPHCQRQLLADTDAAQDQLIARAAGYNVREIGRYFQ